MYIDAEDLDAEQTYKLLTGVVVPRPIAWVSTKSESGVVNLAPFSAFTFVSSKPALLGINIGRKAGRRKDTANNILHAREYVVHIADVALTEAVHASAVEHGPEVSEAMLLGLRLVESARVSVPRVDAAPVAMECRFHSMTPYGDTGSEFFVGEVLRWHVRDGLLRQGKVASTDLDPVCRLGGPNYAALGRLMALAPIAQTAKSLLQGAPPEDGRKA